jgi:regulator of cell morphogenesis and NO signaling
MMISEHETEGRRFDKIAEISKNYNIPEDSCTTYKATLNQLKDFEGDLHRHIHLENNILFPKAIKLENELT